jgi:hypothetical protein
MLIKADCLHTARIINEAEKQYVHSRAHTFLYDATLKDADGSIDLHVGPNAPAGLESNWIPTVGKEAMSLAAALCTRGRFLEQIVQDARCGTSEVTYSLNGWILRLA